MLVSMYFLYNNNIWWYINIDFLIILSICNRLYVIHVSTISKIEIPKGRMYDLSVFYFVNLAIKIVFCGQTKGNNNITATHLVKYVKKEYTICTDWDAECNLKAILQLRWLLKYGIHIILLRREIIFQK